MSRLSPPSFSREYSFHLEHFFLPQLESFEKYIAFAQKNFKRGATWCGPCIALGPTIETLAKDYEGRVNVGKLNVDENSNVSMQYGITSIPCILFIKDGKVVDKQVGVVPKSVLESKIAAHM